MTDRFIYDVPVRWSDMDAYGHVNNARFLTLYEEARVAMFFIGAKEHGLGSFEEGIVIARHEIDYVRPVVVGDRLELRTWIDSAAAASCKRATEIRGPGGVVAARAMTTWAYVDITSGRPTRIPDTIRAAFGMPSTAQRNDAP